MHDNIYPLALVLIYSLTTLNIIVLILSRRKERETSLRAPILMMIYPRAFLYLCCGPRIIAVVPTILLSTLGNVEPDFKLYVISLGLYLSLLGEVCLFT